MTTYVVIPDMQIPYHDRKLTEAFRQFLYQYDLDELLCVGDEIDQPQPSRWNKNMAGEYAGTLQRDIDATHAVIADMRNAIGDKPFHIMRSNHFDRTETYIRRYAPALAGLRDLNMVNLLGYPELNVTFHRQPYNFAPGWTLAHGDEGNLIKSAGGTALSLSRRWGRSVVAGHTHRLGLQHDHQSVGGRVVRHLFGVEAGHFMDMGKADYLNAGSANWQQGFVVLRKTGNVTVPQIVPVVGRTFTVEGVTYKW